MVSTAAKAELLCHVSFNIKRTQKNPQNLRVEVADMLAVTAKNRCLQNFLTWTKSTSFSTTRLIEVDVLSITI